MTLQEILDKNYQWFVVDKNPPGWDEEDGSCVYDGPPIDGKPCRCAIGCCLPDDLRARATEIGGYVVTLFETNEEFAEFFTGNLEKLSDLQNIHDRFARSIDFHERYEVALKQWAKDNDLVYPSQS